MTYLFGTSGIELEVPLTESKTWYPKLLRNL